MIIACLIDFVEAGVLLLSFRLPCLPAGLSCTFWHRHFERCDLGGDSRLGDKCGNHALHSGLRGWTAPVPDDSAGFSRHDWN